MTSAINVGNYHCLIFADIKVFALYRHNAQTKSEGAEEQKTTDTEVTTTQKAFPVTARLSVAKKSKSATFNIRQIRRNK